MGPLQVASDTFFRMCSAIALTVTTITEWTAYILHANYVFVTSVYATVSCIVSLVLTILDYILQAVFAIFVYLFDFLSEVFACIYALLVLLWHICMLVYKLFCLLFAGVETLVMGLWNGGVLTYKTLQQSAMDVVETCESTTDYVAMLVQDFFAYVCGIFTTIGSSATWTVRCVWAGLGYIPAMISYIPACLAAWMSRTWMRCMMWISTAFMGVTSETYIGICVCCLLYVLMSRLVYLLIRRGLTLFNLRRRRNQTNAARRAADLALPFDLGFESDVGEDLDVDHSESDADNETFGGEESESDTQTELTISNDDSDDVNSVGSESDVSINSQTFTSEDSDHEIDVQLPENSGDNSRLSRSSTPSRNLSKDMNNDDFERELERERDKRKCVVCQDNNKSVLILPCRHMCLCVGCANQLVRSVWVGRRVCPLCRTRIERVMDVYV